ncbi:MAG TPA: hypothetical protein VF576_10295 [Rubricoccaceae bacterium]|jgi:hypothetical protein
MAPPHQVDDPNPRGPRVWLKRFGLAGFLFFLVKGLLWLALPALLVMFGGRC